MLRTVFVFNAVGTAWRRAIECASYVLGICLFSAIIWGGWGTMITSWATGEIEGAGAFEVPIAPVRTIIIVFSAICILVYAQLFYLTASGRLTPQRG